jgi:hypothetical protein
MKKLIFWSAVVLAIFIIATVILFLHGCITYVAHQEVIQTHVDEKIDSIKLTGKATADISPEIRKRIADLDIKLAKTDAEGRKMLADITSALQGSVYNIELTGQGEVNHVKVAAPVTAEVPVTNYRTWAGLKVLGDDIWRFLTELCWDIICLTLIIALLTEFATKGLALIPGLSLVRVLLDKLPKVFKSLVYGFLVALGYKWIMKADFSYALVMGGVCVLFANVGWEWLVNKLGPKIKDPLASATGKAKDLLGTIVPRFKKPRDPVPGPASPGNTPVINP